MPRTWFEGLPRRSVDADEDQPFVIEGRHLNQIGRVMQALYLERRRSGDEQRDMAQTLQEAIDNVFPLEE